MRDINELLNVFKILSDETRLRIVMLLSCEDFCVCQLSGMLNVSQPNISKHLSKLKDLGFVTDERRDKFVYYKLSRNNEMIMEIINDVSSAMHRYKALVADREEIASKDVYLSQCKCNWAK